MSTVVREDDRRILGLLIAAEKDIADASSGSARLKLAEAAQLIDQLPNPRTRARMRRLHALRALRTIADECADCHQSSANVRLNTESGTPRCPACHKRWARVTCHRCGRAFNRKEAVPGKQVCPDCRVPQPRLVNGGLPGLGKRR